MRQFLEFVRKEFLHIFRDVRSLMILLAMPLVLAALFGYAISTEVKNTRMAILDEAHDVLTRQIADRFAANPYFTLSHTARDYAEVETLFRRGEIDMALCFGADFATSLATSKPDIQIVLDGCEPNQANTRNAYAQGVLATALAELTAKQGGGTTALTASQPVPTVTQRMLYNPQLKSEYGFVPGIIGVIILLLCTLMTSISIVREKETGSMEILLASPLPPIYIVLAKLTPYLAISIFNLTTILLFSRFVIGVPIAGSLVALVGISLIYIVVALALGLFISTCVGSQMAAMLLSLLMIVPAIYLSGLVFATESMPLPAQLVSMIIPARWFTDAARRLMIQGVDAIYVVKDFVVLSVMAVGLILLDLRLFKTRLD